MKVLQNIKAGNPEDFKHFESISDDVLRVAQKLETEGWDNIDFKDHVEMTFAPILVHLVMAHEQEEFARMVATAPFRVKVPKDIVEVIIDYLLLNFRNSGDFYNDSTVRLDGLKVCKAVDEAINQAAQARV